MSDRLGYFGGRAFPRLALTGLALVWLSGCSADVSRFSDSGNIFTNPFASQTGSASPGAGAPSGQVAAAPLAASQNVARAPLPGASTTPQAVGGSAVGWTPVGGSPVVVAQGETLDSLSGRYGVPAAALLSANGLKSASEVKGGMRMIVPVYSAGGGRAVAKADERGHGASSKEVADASTKRAQKTAVKVAANGEPDSAKSKKTKAEDKAANETKAQQKPAGKAKTPDEGTKPATVAAKADPSKPTGKKPASEDTPTGAVEPKGGEAKTAEADAPEFRWPARGRIIEGFKAGGNDGINISVPAGTSVRAAENGVVVYSGDGLKGYGNLVLIKHPNGFVTAYANNGELDVKRGETVKRGQIIAKSGDSGNVNAPQLHFELRKGSTPVDPTQYLAGL
jgi:murein DD-endopeptidase MepM/ murein hydrolase activator NlpD